MALACRLCIATNGLKGIDVETLPQDDMEMAKHIETVHHCPVKLDGETREQAIRRFLLQYPEARKCQQCKERGAPWTIGEF